MVLSHQTGVRFPVALPSLSFRSIRFQTKQVPCARNTCTDFIGALAFQGFLQYPVRNTTLSFSQEDGVAGFSLRQKRNIV